jgi:hypothetical protein
MVETPVPSAKTAACPKAAAAAAALEQVAAATVCTK